ncbi:MAG: glucose-6-phosphate isomerase [Planctomycetes bacterium]|nr:glucose-6-phosphate isomerase [Planctomycetota bacterium]
MAKTNCWDRFKKFYLESNDFDFSIDVSKVDFSEKWLKDFEGTFKDALKDMKALVKGAVANPDEERMVGHYWLRNTASAPKAELKDVIEKTNKSVVAFTKKVLSGKCQGSDGNFENLLLVGIGGSALGPQFIDQALRPAAKGLSAYFLDNTDPDGIDRVLGDLKGQLGKTLVVVISKSGGTKETRNGMLEVENAYKKAKLVLGEHAVAVTGEGSQLFQKATDDNWVEIFPMWDWVGGRTSVMSAVGLLPAALSGYKIQDLLEGAKEMDKWTMSASLKRNPAALLSAMWYFAGNGKGEKDMVILPYKDRLELFSKYLQQLIMESIGKAEDLDGKTVNQGIAVYGNKGSTDQHAYIQQLRDGLHNFFVTFIEVKKSRQGRSMNVENGATTGDYLEGFFLGTRKALGDSGRQSITLSVDEVNEKTVGRLIALFERAVGYYASYVNINAYHQPGVEAGKKAAQLVLELQQDAVKTLKACKKAMSAPELAKKMSRSDETETLFKLLSYLSANSQSGVKVDGKVAGPRTKYICK